MNPQQHPDWCTRTACTAYGVNSDDLDHLERWHRSEPLVVKTGDPTVALCVHKFAEADGSDEHVEVVTLEVPLPRDWHLAEPVAGRAFVLRSEAPAELVQAVAQLV